jgi:hypothetical protein
VLVGKEDGWVFTAQFKDERGKGLRGGGSNMERDGAGAYES